MTPNWDNSITMYGIPSPMTQADAALSDTIAGILEKNGNADSILDGTLPRFLPDHKVDTPTARMYAYIFKCCPKETKNILAASFDDDVPNRMSALGACITSIAGSTGISEDRAGSFVFTLSRALDLFNGKAPLDYGTPSAAPTSNTVAPSPAAAPSGGVIDLETYDGPYTFSFSALGVSITKYAGDEKDVVLPAKVRFGPKEYVVNEVGSSAFQNNGLESVTFHGGIRRIGDLAFINCKKLKSLTFDGCAPVIARMAFQSTGIRSLVLPPATTFEDGAQFAYSGIKYILLPRDCKKITAAMFYNCSELVSVDVPDTVETICNQAFESCKSLVSIAFPGAKSFETDVFTDCASLKTVTVPKGVECPVPWGVSVIRI